MEDDHLREREHHVREGRGVKKGESERKID
jgi:hypothetical protein